MMPSSSAIGGSRGRTGSTSCLRKIHWDQQTVKMITVPEYLDTFPKIQLSQPSYFELGLQGLLRSLARRLQRLDLPPSP